MKTAVVGVTAAVAAYGTWRYVSLIRGFILFHRGAQR